MKYNALAATRQLIWFTFHFRLPCNNTSTAIQCTLSLASTHTPHTRTHSSAVLEAERYAIITFVISNLKCKLLQWSVVVVNVVVVVAFFGTAPVSTSLWFSYGCSLWHPLHWEKYIPLYWAWNWRIPGFFSLFKESLLHMCLLLYIFFLFQRISRFFFECLDCWRGVAVVVI